MTETGFTDAAIDSAHAFRIIMQAMSRPGVPVALDAALQAPAPLHVTSAAVLLTLCDFQTPVWLSPALRNDRTVHYLRFHTGAPMVENVEDAQFAFLSTADEWAPPSLFAQGTHEYPDRSATLVIQAGGFNNRVVALTGPGIRGPVGFGVEGLGQAFWAAMSENHARFPIGVDVIFAAPLSLAAVPRSTVVRMAETV
jgi:alpha-D-ribose 1-methylphosphonate 5-triphosphate synthase subunit PhnH